MARTAELIISFLLAGRVASQQIGTKVPEVHPKLTTYKCTKDCGCKPQNTSIVIDQDWRFVSAVHGDGICKTPGLGPLNETLCPDTVTCASNCALEGANYTQFGVHIDNADSLTLNMYVGDLAVQPRVYLLDSNGSSYENFRLANAEISFDTDMSNLPCGMNGALYLSEMSMTGGRGDLNPAGASMGTGYCDAQCPTSYTWINGVANLNHSQGACCNEMDLWEANSAATKYTPHSCTEPGLYVCSGNDCAVGGVCTHTGCGYNAYVQGHKGFYAKGGTVDTSRPFTVVTQFITADNTSTGELTEIRQFYVQDGRTISNPQAVSGLGNSLTDQFCGNFTEFEDHGGLKTMGQALSRGMVLVFAIWNQPNGFMNWLDSGSNGPCNDTEGDPQNIFRQNPGTSVTFSNIRWGDFGTTY